MEDFFRDLEPRKTLPWSKNYAITEEYKKLKQKVMEYLPIDPHTDEFRLREISNRIATLLPTSNFQKFKIAIWRMLQTRWTDPAKSIGFGDYSPWMVDRSESIGDALDRTDGAFRCGVP